MIRYTWVQREGLTRRYVKRSFDGLCRWGVGGDQGDAHPGVSREVTRKHNIFLRRPIYATTTDIYKGVANSLLFRKGAETRVIVY